MSGVIGLILIIVVSFLSLKLYLVKRQLREVSRQLKEVGEHFVSIDFVDKDLEELVLQINKMLALMEKIKAESVKGEKSIKSSISMISHDMRTPLTSVIGYLQLAEKNCKDEENLHNIKIALDRANYCSKLVNDFFELSIVDSDKYIPVMEKINICEVVCEEILANYPAFEKNNMIPKFEQADDIIWVWADKKLLNRVIQNLISNGIKYSNGEMTFSIVKTDKICLTISNSVSDSIDVEKIFDKFYRADSARKSEGIGLGLYICRKFVEDMSGKISAHSTSDRLSIKIELLLP